MTGADPWSVSEASRAAAASAAAGAAIQGADGSALLSGRDLAARVGGRVLFEGLSLDVRRGELLALTGPNGSGKSTLLRILLGLARPTAGRVVRAAGVRVGYVPQLDPGDPGLPFPAATVAAQGLVGRASSAHRSLARRVADALARVGYAAPQSRRYTRLSGGERRRVLLARALAGETDVLALDEPTAGVDVEGEREVIDLVLSEVRSGRCGAIWVCHGLSLVEHAAHRVLHLGGDA
jgi:zinc transport system ATP-binding protein